MASLVQIRNVPEQTQRVLKARAAARGESLNSYLVRLLVEETGQPTIEEVFERALARNERVSLDAVEALRAERDEHAAKRRR